MVYFEPFILGIVQGLTEFLPISSSGHLAIGHFLFGAENADLLFDIFMHVATLAAVFLFYRREIKNAVRAVFRARIPGTSWLAYRNWRDHDGRGLLLQLLIATLVTGIIGIACKDYFESLFSSPRAVGIALCINAGILWLSRCAKPHLEPRLLPGVFGAVALGLAQSVAITPGISRSGATIVMALILGMEKGAAVRFSFFLAIPAILGALLLQLDESVTSSFSFMQVSVGFASALVTGLAALLLLVYIARVGKLHYFAPYTLSLGLLTVIWSLFL